ncbi:unnamed protein product [Ostreobium quekettii]|uniref:Thymidine kinase n=1 Tax=Ostreobium quekettii TaxID=121088 RepID=A0A8S1J0M7_9CHLO|nr:unnamed protein product [Ostreobium quekettii]
MLRTCVLFEQGIAIDEGQFFPDLVEFCLEATDRDGKTLYVAGLDGDFTRSPFSVNGTCQLLNLIPLADVVDKYLARCRYCASNAPFTFRTVKDDRAVLVGGADMYIPVCRKHYVKMWKELEAR